MTHFVFPRLDAAVEDPESDVLTVPDILRDLDLDATPDLDDGDTSGGAFRVILYDDDWHPIDQVIEQVVKACECGKLKAIKITLDTHRKGRAVCYKGGRGKCQKVAKVLREIRLQCEVDSDD